MLAIDQRSRALVDALLVNYSTRSAQAKPFERRYWRASLELSRSFAAALNCLLQYMRNDQSARGWREYAPAVVLRIFRHRQVEFLLRPFLNDAPIPGTWAEVHAAYQFAEAQGWSHHPIPDKGDRDAPPSTLQKEYVHILLLELMNGGQFSPYDAFWLSRWIPHWNQVVSLKGDLIDRGPEAHHFVVDLDSAEGLKRVSPGQLGHALYLDASPLLAMIEAEIVSLHDPLNPVRVPSSFGSSRQVKLLRKVAANYSPRPPRVNRRGERKAAASAVKAVIGLGTCGANTPCVAGAGVAAERGEAEHLCARSRQAAELRGAGLHRAVERRRDRGSGQDDRPGAVGRHRLRARVQHDPARHVCARSRRPHTIDAVPFDRWRSSVPTP